MRECWCRLRLTWHFHGLPLLPCVWLQVFGSSRGEAVADIPLQLAIWHNPAPHPRFLETGPLTLSERVPIGSPAVVVACGSTAASTAAAAAAGAAASGGLWPHHGRVGTVVAHDEASGTLSLRAPVLDPEPAFGLGIARAVTDKYFPTGTVARTLQIRPDILGRLLGSLVVDVDRNEVMEREKKRERYRVLAWELCD